MDADDPDGPDYDYETAIDGQAGTGIFLGDYQLRLEAPVQIDGEGGDR